MVKHRETESESEGAAPAEEPRFRISVCLKRFFSDERARAYVSVSPRRRVRALQRRLRRLFPLPRALRLLSRGHLLPPDEPLALLERDDLVEVLPVPAPADEPVEVPLSAQAGETAPAPDVVDSFEKMATEEPERSPSPVMPDDLTETKRRALLMLEQFSAQPAPPRRRRVRRRRRAAAPLLERSHADDEPVPDVAAAPLRERSHADDEPALDGAASPLQERSHADDEPAPDSAAGLREPEAEAMVLRNELLPRAPRVVRPLCDQMTAAGLLVTSPTEIFT